MWHESQRTRQQEDGSIIFEADIALTEDFKSWIKNWGAKATVIEPLSLKKEIISEAKEMLNNYCHEGR